MATSDGSRALPDNEEATLGDLVALGDCSVRLSNCISRDPDVSAMTVRQYISDPPLALTLKTKNMGRKTAQELRNLVLKYLAEHGELSRPNTEADEERGDRRQRTPSNVILALVRPLSFPDAVLQFDLSPRLRNVLLRFAEEQRRGAEPESFFHTMADALGRWRQLASILLEFGNFGTRSLTELKSAIEGLVTRRLSMVIPAGELPSVLTIDELEAPQDTTFCDALLRLTPTASTDRGEPYADTSGEDLLAQILSLKAGGGAPREQTARLLDTLPDKERDVLLRRYGLGGHKPMTLEEVGRQFYVTRERVRQIENKAMGRLRLGERLTVFKQLIEREEAELWASLTDRSGLLLRTDVEAGLPSIDPTLKLALCVVHGSVDGWIGRYGKRFDGVWIRTDRPLDAVRSSIAATNAYLKGHPLPRSIAGISEDLGISDCEVLLAVRLSHNFQLFQGYITEGMLGAQARRTVRLHKLFLELQGADLVDFNSLLAVYRSRYPDDDVVSRIIELQMRRAPHLFIRIFDAVWLTVPDQGVVRRKPGVIRHNKNPATLAREGEGDTISRWLIDTLRRFGPARGVALRDRAAAASSRIEARNIYPMLLMNPTFVRLAPAVFGLPEHVAALSADDAKLPDALFGSNQCRFYVMARKAGEPLSLYPAWSWKYEAQLCQWSKHHSPTEVFRSLLYVAQPENWPISDQDKSVWARTKTLHADYQLPFPKRKPLFECEAPRGNEVLGALAYLGTIGGLSWISLNRIGQRRTDDTSSSAGLALLVALQALKPAHDWCDLHLPDAGHDRVYSRMARELTRTGCLDWLQPDLATLVQEAKARAAAADLGWIDRAELLALLERLLTPQTRQPAAFAEPEEILGADWFNDSSA